MVKMGTKNIIGISFGHNDRFNTGAVDILNEDVVNRQVGQRVIDIINENGLYRAVRLYKPNVTSYRDSLYSRVELANELECIIAIDIHHNSYRKESANGTECLAMSSRGKELGRILVDSVCNEFGFTNRGVKHNTYVFNRYTNMCSTIYEGFFISNRSDCSKYNSNREAIAIVKGIYKYLGCKGIPNSITNVYIVKQGDTLTSISKKVGKSISYLAEKNNIKNIDLIIDGQKIYY